MYEDYQAIEAWRPTGLWIGPPFVHCFVLMLLSVLVCSFFRLFVWFPSLEDIFYWTTD